MSAVPCTSRKGGRPGGRGGSASRRAAPGGWPRRAPSGRRGRASRRSGPRGGRCRTRGRRARRTGTTAATRVSSAIRTAASATRCPPGRLAHEGEPLRVEMKPTGVLPGPTDGGEDVLDRRRVRVPGREAVAHREPGDAGLGERSGRASAPPACGRPRSSRRRGRGARPGTAPCRPACTRRASGSPRRAARTRCPARTARAAGTRAWDRRPAAEPSPPRRRRCPDEAGSQPSAPSSTAADVSAAASGSAVERPGPGNAGGW